VTTNAILPNGSIAGLNLGSGQNLLIRDYDEIAIQVNSSL